MIRLWLLRMLAPLLGRAPRLGYLVAALVAAVAWRTSRARREVMIRNLLPFCDGDAALAEREARRAFDNVARYWADICTLPYRDLSRFERTQMTIEDSERLVVLEQPGPLIAVSAHTGNSELAIQALTYRGRAFVALVEALHPPRFSRELVRRRSAAGGKFYVVGIGGVRACLDALRRGELVGLMGDRDIQGTGVCTDFAGRCVRLPRGPWELARRTDALVLPVLTRRAPSGRLTLYVEEPYRVERKGDPESDIRKAVERWAVILERHIRREPGQWAVLEDFWQVHGCGEG